MDIKNRAFFTDGNEYFCFSVVKQRYIVVEGEDVPYGENERMVITPSTIEDLKDFSPELYPVYKAMCTPEIIKKWEEYIKEQEKLMP